MPTITVQGRFENLVEISDFVVKAAKLAGLEDESVYAVQLAVDEACSNIIEHGYGGDTIGEIECTCETTEDGLLVIIRDWGRSFDPEGVPELDISIPVEEVVPRGAGLYLIRKLMDDVDFKFSSQEGNVLTILKRR